MATKTLDYKLFRKNHCNRNICPAHVKKLKESISRNNLLYLLPITVNNEMEVIDGQHRLEAASQLGLPIYYQVMDNSSADDIQLINFNQKRWVSEDYLNYYANSGNEHYMSALLFIKEQKISLRILMALLNHSIGGQVYRNFSKGEFVFGDKEREASLENLLKTRHIIDLIRKVSIDKKPFITHNAFLQSLVAIITHPDVDYETLVKRIETKVENIRNCSGKLEFYKNFQKIYNWKNPSPVKWED